MFDKETLELVIIGSMVGLALIILLASIERIVAFKLISKKLDQYQMREELEIELNSKMTVLYTIATNTVYLGLLGTVGGVILALDQGAGDKEILMQSMSYALVATAAALVVSIPSTIAYNFLAAKIDKILLTWDQHYGYEKS